MAVIRRNGTDPREINNLGRKLSQFLGEFDDCFRRSPSRKHLRTYVKGQLSDLARKSVEPIALAAWTFDEWYGRDGGFLDELDRLGQSYIGEVPSTFTGWLHEPQVLLSPRLQERRQLGRKRHFPRLSRKALPACAVGNLARYSRVFQKQQWKRFRIKDGGKGPMVWEVKYSRCYRRHGHSGLPGPTHTLIVARNVLDPRDVKYFVSNMVPGRQGLTLQWLLWVAFSRWPIERCFEVGKRELGMDHFEVRSWCAIHRHLYISQLFCARVHQHLGETNGGHVLPDGRTGPRSGQRLDHRLRRRRTALGSSDGLSKDRRADCLLSTSQPTGPKVTPKNDTPPPATIGHQSQSTEILCPA